MHFPRLSLSTQILAALGAGMVLGLATSVGIVPKIGLIDQGLEIVGGWFLASLRLVTVPLVFVSLAGAGALFENIKVLGRVGVKAFAMFVGSTLIAVCIGTALAITVAPGKGVSFTGGEIAQAPPPPQIKNLLINLVPSNPFEALAQGNMLQVICCGLLACAALALAGQSGKNLERLCLDVREALMQLVVLMMRVAPFGVFALSARSFASLGRGGITSLLGYMLVHVLGLLIQFFVVYGLGLVLLARLNPWVFFRKMREVHIVAFSTDSSGATMPTTLRVVEKNLGVSRGIAAFVIPLGVSVNKDGSAVLHSVGAVFLAQVFGIQLHASQYILIASMSVLSSLGTVGVPGTGIIMLAMVLSQAGIPLEGIGLLLGVDRLLDMLRTVVNVTGHSVASCVIAASEKQIDRTTYLATA